MPYLTPSKLAEVQVLQQAFDETSKTLMVANKRIWTSVHAPAAATKATITQAAASAGLVHICTFISATISCDATAQTPIGVKLFDGTSSGTLLWAGTIAAPANGMGGVALSNLNIAGTAATAMTLEFSAAGVALSLQAVTVGGYTTVAI